jgi:hypothetical protein
MFKAGLVRGARLGVFTVRSCLAGDRSELTRDGKSVRTCTSSLFGRTLTFTQKLEPLRPSEMETIPAYRVLDNDGTILPGAQEPDVRIPTLHQLSLILSPVLARAVLKDVRAHDQDLCNG